MKNLIIVLVACGSVLTTLPLAAETEMVNGYTWTYRIIDNSAEIFNNYSAAILPKPTGHVTIPVMLGGKPVTNIGGYAFSGCSGLTSVTIPDGVTNIGARAFYRCNGLTSVTIGNSVTGIGDYAFSNCRGLTSVTIGNSVTSIGSSAFDGCNGLTSVMIGNSVTSIGDDAFSGCSGLASVTIPDSVTNIGAQAFEDCCGLTSVTIGGGVTSIGDDAFSDCSGLTSVTIPSGVTNIGAWAFSGCSGLASVTIPDSVTSIGERAFSGCSGLASVTIPDSVTNIGYDAFSDCSGLTSVTIPQYICTNGFGYVFSPYQSITNVVVSGNVTSIGDDAFSGCRALTSVTIPDSVTNIGGYAFSGCSGLTSVSIPDGVTSIGALAFSNCRGLTSVTIGNSVMSIGYDAFSGCSGLTSVTIPDSVTNIGARAFGSCSGLTSFVVDDGNTFYKSVLGLLLTKDGKVLMAVPAGLTSVSIPDSVTSIGDEAFDGCSGLTNLLFRGNAPSVGSGAFYSVKSGCTAYVREGSTGWGVDIPGTWEGMNIQYLTPEVEIAVANEAGEGVVALDAGEFSEKVEVASGVTLEVKGENLDVAALAAKIIPKPHEGGQDTSFFKVKSKFVDGGVSLAVVLDEDAVKPDDTATEVVAGANMAAIDSAAEGANVSVKLSNAKPGLYYGVAVAGDVAGLEKAAENVSLSRAGADGVEVPVVKPAGGAAFFKVVVSDRAQ